MPLFKRKEKPTAPQGAPEIPGLNLGDNQSLLNLASTAVAPPTDSQNAKDTAALSGAPANLRRNGDAAGRVTGAAAPAAAAPLSRKYDTMKDLSSPYNTTSTTTKETPDSADMAKAREGHHRSQSSLSRSMSHGAVPYHLPWTRNLTLEEGAADGHQPTTRPESSSSASPAQPSANTANTNTTTPPRRRGAPPSSYVAAASGLTGVFNPAQHIDFRTSPSSVPQPSPAQRRQVVDAARKQSLKRSKAPQELNVMLFGATNTGKTSFVRTLLATCDLSLCSHEARQAAAMFGIASDARHVTYDTDPITPTRTTQYSVLSGVDLHPSALVPIAALEAGVDVSSVASPRPPSMFSGSRQSGTVSGGAGNGRVQLSICDTPGLDFEMEDNFEVERKVAAALRYIEARLQRTLLEESKVQRLPRNDGHVHLILYFIDPRFMLERVATRRARRDQARYLAAHGSSGAGGKEEAVTASNAAEADVRRARSTSLFGQGKSPLQHDTTLTKEAQTAQLRQSMEALQVKRSAPREAEKKRPTSRDSTASSTIPLPSDDLPPSTTPLDDVGVEGLSQRQLAILARLSQRANVLPIIAKADTLTQSQLEEVRSAVRSSILKANLDLGTFDVDVLRRKRKPVPGSAAAAAAVAASRNGTGAATATKDAQRQSADTPDGIATAAETPLSDSPVKVIRIKSRRSYSATGGDRMSVSVSGHSLANGTEDGHATGSTLGHTAPLFDSPAAAAAAEDDEEDDVPPPVTLARMIPFSLFVPEPVRVRPRLSRSPSGCGLERQGSMNSIAENAPPVPPLPRDLVNVKKQSGRPATGTSSNGSAHGLGLGSVETEEVLDDSAPLSMTIGDDSGVTRQSMESAAVRPTSSSTIGHEEQQRSFLQPPPPSRRFQRDYRFGHANVLDARQCDFTLLRTCMLSSHVEALRESTAQRYERFRSQRLETRQLTRQTSLSALPSSYVTSSPSLS